MPVFVLIETLWNVKVYLLMVTTNNNNVLIETLWNVKKIVVWRNSNQERF